MKIMQKILNIINVYKDMFLSVNDLSIYKKTRLMEYMLYMNLIENSLKSLIAYYFSESYGNDNYLKIDNFETY